MPCRGCRPPIVQQSRLRAAARIRWSPNVPCLDTPYAVVNEAFAPPARRRGALGHAASDRSSRRGAALGRRSQAARRYSHNICVTVGGEGLDPCPDMPRPELLGAKRRIEMEVMPMSIMRNGHAVSSTRRGLPGVLFWALLALALLDPGSATAQEANEMEPTEKHIQ